MARCNPTAVASSPSLLKNNKMLKVVVKNKRLTAGWDDFYLQPGLFGP